MWTWRSPLHHFPRNASRGSVTVTEACASTLRRTTGYPGPRDLDLEGPGRNRHPPLARAVHISGLHALALGNEEIVGVDPGIVGSKEAAARVRDRQARR